MVAVPSAVMVVAFAAAIREPRVGPPAVEPGSTPPGFVSAEAAPIPTVAARTPAQAPPTSTRATRIPVRAALSRDLLVTYAINVLALYAFFMLLNWLPYYLQSDRGVSEAASGLVASLMPWASIPSSLAAGLLSDRLGDRIAPLRLLLPAAALTVFGLAVVRGPVPLYGLIIAYGLVGKSTSDPLLTARAAELAPPERLATVMGFLNFSGMVASVAAPFVTGLLIRASGTMAPAFYLAGGLLLVAAVLALLTGRRTVLKSAPS
jgi:sugar phosphate permease